MTPSLSPMQSLIDLPPRLLNPAILAQELSGGSFRLNRHATIIGKALRDVTFGRIKRLIINIPPQHGKSTEVAEYFPAYQFAFWPETKFMYASYEAEYAASWSAKARQVIREHGKTIVPGRPLEIDPNMDRRDWWGIKGGGYFVSAGAGGPLTGKGADVAVIDDPHKNSAEALSKTIQESIDDWYKSTLYTRLSPYGAVIIIQTRWDVNDQTGRVLARAKSDPYADQWVVLDLPALARCPQCGDDGLTEVNACGHGERDQMGRLPGEPLWPEGGWTRERYLAVRSNQGHFWFNAMYQQKPVPVGGGVFKREYFRYARDHKDTIELLTDDGPKHVPKNLCRCIQTVDLASSVKTSADYFVIQTWIISPWNDLILWNTVRTRVEGPDQLPLLTSNFRRWGAGQIGIESVQYQQTMLQAAIRAGLPAVELKADRDKFQRALGIAARYEAHTVYHLEGSENLGPYEEELLTFNPTATTGHDDMVDCAAYAARFLYEGAGQVAAQTTVVHARRHGV